MARKTAKEIVQAQMPDMEIVEGPPAAVPDSVRSAAQPGPSMASLRKKYLGADADADEEEVEADGSSAPYAAPVADAGESDIEVRVVRSKRPPADPADDPGPRTVIFSKKRGDIIGSQG